MDGGILPNEREADPDEGVADEPRARHDPLRRCLVTGTVQPKVGMIRFVLAPDGSVVPDIEGRLPGRGLWVGADRGLLSRAIQRNLFAKAARQSARVTAGMLDQVTAQLARQCLNLIGLARRAGQAVVGFDQVHEALRTGRVGHGGAPGLLLAACDGAADGRNRLRALAAGLPIVEEFEAEALGAALGREQIVVHALLARGTLAERLTGEAARFAGLRNSPVGRKPAGQPE